MTHAESQDLLLDLAYGELDASRAAEVEEHVSSCPECRKEKEALAEARRMAAPIRDLEEPSSGFDDRILRTARAQAQLDHDGNVGQVIEVTGAVRPLGVDAARIDAHGPVNARPAGRRRPRWVLRTAVGGSVAAAAALALVVGNTLEERRTAAKAAAARASDFEIRVKSAPPAGDTALRDADVKREEKDRPGAPAAGSADSAPPPVAPSPPEEKARHGVAQPSLHKSAPSRMQGSGGDAVEAQGKLAAKKAKQAETARDEVPAASRVDERTRGAPAVSDKGSVVGGMLHATPPAATPPASASAGEPAPGTVAAAAPAVAAQARNKAVVTAAPAVEANAQQARHAGNYVLAASLYREAAAARQREGDLGTAAWNLAHAVECLSAAGRFDEARKVRDELVRLYPAETTALSAAQRALREVDVPAAKAPADLPR